MSVETQFEKTGTLKPPGPIGRVVRLLFGVWITYVFFQFVDIGFIDAQKTDRFFSWQPPTHPSFWVAVVIFLWVLPYVVNIGFGQNWRRKPQWILLGVLAVVAGVGYSQNGSFWSPALAWIMLTWLIYVTAHLGFSFLCSAILGTPGCEMRAFPHLLTRMTGQETAEHYCPGFLDKLDKWELNKRTQNK